MNARRATNGAAKERDVDGELLDAMPAADPQAEREVLSAMLAVPNVIDDVCLQLSAADFYEQRHAAMFEILVQLHNAGKRIDIAVFRTALQKAKDASGEPLYASVGGAAYLSDIVRACPTAANAGHYAGHIRDCAIKRELSLAGEMFDPQGPRSC